MPFWPLISFLNFVAPSIQQFLLPGKLYVKKDAAAVRTYEFRISNMRARRTSRKDMVIALYGFYHQIKRAVKRQTTTDTQKLMITFLGAAPEAAYLSYEAKNNGTPFCVGAILASDKILTAAHCLLRNGSNTILRYFVSDIEVRNRCI